MKFYFKLQYTRLLRWLNKIGLNPIIGLVLVLALFCIISGLLFSKSEYANWIYSATMISVVIKLSASKRNNELRKTFAHKEYQLLRLVENSMVALPFLIYYLYQKEFLPLLLGIIVTLALSLFTSNYQLNKTIPTPFKSYPFEFIIGFRKAFWIIAIAYFLVIKAIEVGNYNLSLFGFLLIFFISIFNYQSPESKYVVWIHTSRTKAFLLSKLRTSIICVSILAVPALVAILFAFSQNWIITVAVYLFGYILIGTMILAKYSAFPQEMNVPQIILLAIGILFPPMLPIAIWIFYSQAIKRLNPILEC